MRRRYVRRAVQDVTNLVRIFLVHAGQREAREPIGRGGIEAGRLFFRATDAGEEQANDEKEPLHPDYNLTKPTLLASCGLFRPQIHTDIHRFGCLWVPLLICVNLCQSVAKLFLFALLRRLDQLTKFLQIEISAGNDGHDGSIARFPG